MLWGQKLVVYTDHQDLIRDSLGLNSDRVYRWILLEEYSLEIIYIKGIHNTVVDALLRLDYGPSSHVKENWMTVNQCLNFYVWKCTDVEESPFIEHKDMMNFVFANSSKDDAIYPLMVPEIVDAQKGDKTLEKLKETDNYSLN